MARRKTTTGTGAICGILVILWAIFPTQVSNFMVNASTMFGNFFSNLIFSALRI